MGQDLNNLFRSDPYAFARANVLWPGDAEGVSGLSAGTSTNYFTAKTPIGSGESLFQLKGEKRIWSCDLERRNGMVILNKRPGAVVAPAMAIYYLPWAKDQMLRTTLRKTRDQSLRGTKTAIAQNAPNPSAMPAQDTNDPDIFLLRASTGAWWSPKERARSQRSITATRSPRPVLLCRPPSKWMTITLPKTESARK